MATDDTNPDPFIAPELAKSLEHTQLDKFHRPGGHGFAAEDANALADRLRGKTVQVVGPGNAPNGPDRIVDGVCIQTKYYASAAATVADAFDPSSGMYRYAGQLLEVPRDQYDDCLRLMRERISKGQVPGVRDPQAAEQIVKRGEVTYKQARNIARAGNVDSIVFDIKSQAISSACMVGISSLIHFAHRCWHGEPPSRALRSALMDGLAVGTTSLVSGVIASQVLRTRAAAIGAIAMRDGLRVVAGTSAGNQAIQLVAQASLGKAVYGAAAVSHVSKLLRSNVVTSTVVFAVTSAPDFYRAAVERNISWGQLSKNLVVNASAIGAGAGGWVVGAAAGAAIGSVVPVVGTAVCGFIGGLVGAIAGGSLGTKGASVLMDQFVEDDARRMTQLLQAAVAELATDYMLSDTEIQSLGERIRETADAKWLRSMYHAGVATDSDVARQAFAYSAFDDVCLQIIRRRAAVTAPSVDAVRCAINELATEILPPEGTGEPTTDGGVTSSPLPAMHLCASPGDGQVVLTWGPSARATNYAVYRRPATESQCVSRLVEAELRTTSYTDTGLVNGSPYVYVVRARTADGSHESSNEAAATPRRPDRVEEALPAGPSSSPAAKSALLFVSGSGGAGEARSGQLESPGR